MPVEANLQSTVHPLGSLKSGGVLAVACTMQKLMHINFWQISG